VNRDRGNGSDGRIGSGLTDLTGIACVDLEGLKEFLCETKDNRSGTFVETLETFFNGASVDGRDKVLTEE